MIEREVKAVVDHPETLRCRLGEAGRLSFAGRMEDRRYDCDNRLTAVDQVLRLRRYRATDGGERAVVGWKGPVSVSEGHKLRAEHEISTPDAASAAALLEALGYHEVHAIDRYVEYYEVAGATVRLEWYPRMDVLVEVEGSPETIEKAMAATGLPREAFSADALTDFVGRYQARTGQPAAVALGELGGEEPAWPW